MKKNMLTKQATEKGIELFRLMLKFAPDVESGIVVKIVKIMIPGIVCDHNWGRISTKEYIE